MSGPDIVTVVDRISVVDRTPDVVQVGYTFITSSGSHSHTPAAIGALAVANNLNDVANTATARTNLGAAATGHTHTGTYDPAGTAAAAVAAHEAAGDPHPTYLTAAEGNAAYVPLARQITAGTGLTGGGTLTADRTIAANVGTTAGTLAAGDDTRITGAVQSTLVDAKGDLLVGTAADTLARLAIGSNGKILTADSGQSAGMKWADPAASGMDQIFPLAGHGILAATAPLETFSISSSFGSSGVVIARCWIPAGVAITSLWIAVSTAGTFTSGVNQLALYDDTGTKLFSTADDNNLYASTGWRGGALVGGPVAAQSTGRFVYLGAVTNGFSGVGIPYALAGSNTSWFNNQPGGGGNRRCMFTFDGSLPSSFNPTSYGGSGSSFLPPLVVT